MGFGTKAGSIASMKNQLKSRKSRGALSWIPEDGIEVRFLAEPEEWVRYTEAYSPSLKRTWPVPEDNAPAAGDERMSVRYAVPVLDIRNDRTTVLKVPVTLVELLVTRAEKRGSLTDTDYELYKSGEGKDTTYGYDPGDKTKRDMDKYDLPDIEEALEKEYLAVWGDQEQAAPEPSRSSKRKPAVELDEDDDDLDDDDLDDEDDEDLADDDSDDEDDDEVEDDDEDYWTREDLEDLTLAELRALARNAGVETRGLKKNDLIDAIAAD